MDRYLEFTCLFIAFITFSVATANENNEQASCDYGSVMRIVEKLEKRVSALEAENEQQRTEIAELKALLETGDKDQEQPNADDQETGTNEHDAEGTVKQNRIRRANPDVTVAFYAALQGFIYHLGQGQNVRFDNAVTNVGNAYDPHTGVFKAPLAGVYVFSTTVLTNGQDTTHYGFALNGVTITTLFVHGAESRYDADSQTIILQLQPGDDVSVQHIDNDKSLYGSNHSVFSGFLLSTNQETTVGIIG